MIFTETALPGAFILDLERREDERGFFARAFCQHEFADHGLKPVIAQANVAYNKRPARCAACTSSSRRRPRRSSSAARAARSSTSSSTCAPRARRTSQSVSVELNEDNGRALYVPERFAHGYQTLATRTETSYQVGEFYAPETEGGLAYDDPRLGPRVAAAGRRDLGEGRAVGAARRRRARGAPTDDRSTAEVAA